MNEARRRWKLADGARRWAVREERMRLMVKWQTRERIAVGDGKIIVGCIEELHAAIGTPGCREIICRSGDVPEFAWP